MDGMWGITRWAGFPGHEVGRTLTDWPGHGVGRRDAHGAEGRSRGGAEDV